MLYLRFIKFVKFVKLQSHIFISITFYDTIQNLKNMSQCTNYTRIIIACKMNKSNTEIKTNLCRQPLFIFHVRHRMMFYLSEAMKKYVICKQNERLLRSSSEILEEYILFYVILFLSSFGF